MSPQDTAVREFAARLAEDEAFRELAERDPRAALAELGIEDEPALVPDEVTLPAAEELGALVRAETPDDDDDDDDDGDEDDEPDPSQHISPPQNVGLRTRSR